MDRNSTAARVREYFRVKQRQLQAAADLPICQHAGLIGGHREEIQRVYLREVLPKRFEVGRGMVYGISSHTHEADLVLWDAQNYLSLPMLDHSFFFAEAVHAVLEVKSRWDHEQMADVLLKSEAILRLIAIPAPSLEERLYGMELDVAALRSDRELEGFGYVRPRIGSAAMFLTGGASFGLSSLDSETRARIDGEWPDIVLLLEPGRVIFKRYEEDEDGTWRAGLEQYELGGDALLAFTNGLLVLLAERTVQLTAPLLLEHYVPELSRVGPEEWINFAFSTPARGTPFWREASTLPA